MRIKILLLAFVLTFNHLASAALDSTKILKRWKITKHTKKGKVIAEHADDFIQFNTYNAYEQVQQGIFKRGTWKVNTTTKVLTMKSGKETHEWTITELTDRSLKASNKQEVLEMEVINMKFCEGDPYDPLVILCGRWKVADFHLHFSQVSRPGDYICFFPDGTMEEVFQGVYKKMTWKYDSENSQLFIHTHAWNIKGLNQKKIVAEGSAKGESLMLVK